jgi:hypothetical protein
MTNSTTNSIFRRQVHGLNQRVWWHNLIGLVLLLGIGSTQLNYYRNCLTGPAQLDAQKLLQLKEGETLAQDYVTISVPEALETGYSKVRYNKRTKVETTEKKYLLIPIGGDEKKALIVEADADVKLKDVTFTGGLEPADSKVQTEVMAGILKDAPFLQGKLMPYVLQTGEYKSWLFLSVPLILLGSAFCGWNIYRAQTRRQDLLKHPAYQKLAKYGEPEVVAEQIDQELQTHYNTERLIGDKTYLTPSWLLLPKTYGLQMTRLDQLVWIYKKVTRHSVNFIPTGKSFEIVMNDRDGHEQTIKASEDHIDQLIEQIFNQVPWVIVGFDDDIRKLWHNQRQEFYAVVEERKKNAQAA